jgi:hypothetical protein
VGILVDLAGNDSYFLPGLGGGAGNCDGIGIFADYAGDDTYESDGLSALGIARLSGEWNPYASARAIPTAGLFIDAGGTDTYTLPEGRDPPVGNDLTWTWNEDVLPPEDVDEHGAGIDGTGDPGL